MIWHKIGDQAGTFRTELVFWTEMRSSDPQYYIVPEGFVELRRALEDAVKRAFGEKYTAPFTKQSLKAESKKKHRQRRWNAVSKLFLRGFQSGTLIAYLRRDGNADPIDRAHWDEWKSKWRPFASDALGDTDAPVYLVQKEALKDYRQLVPF